MTNFLPPVEQNIQLRAKIRKLQVGDSLSFGPNRLAKVLEILTTEDNSRTPNYRVRTGDKKEYFVFKNQVKSVIHKSTDNYDDLQEPDFTVLKNYRAA